MPSTAVIAPSPSSRDRLSTANQPVRAAFSSSSSSSEGSSSASGGTTVDQDEGWQSDPESRVWPSPPVSPGYEPPSGELSYGELVVLPAYSPEGVASAPPAAAPPAAAPGLAWSEIQEGPDAASSSSDSDYTGGCLSMQSDPLSPARVWPSPPAAALPQQNAALDPHAGVEELGDGPDQLREWSLSSEPGLDHEAGGDAADMGVLTIHDSPQAVPESTTMTGASSPSFSGAQARPWLLTTMFSPPPGSRASDSPPTGEIMRLVEADSGHHQAASSYELQAPGSSPGGNVEGSVPGALEAEGDRRRSSSMMLQQALKEVQQERASQPPPPSLRESVSGTDASVTPAGWESAGMAHMQQCLSSVREEQQQQQQEEDEQKGSGSDAPTTGRRRPELPLIIHLGQPGRYDDLEGEDSEESTPTFIPVPRRSSSGSAIPSPLHSPVGGSGKDDSSASSRFRKPQPLILLDPYSSSPSPSVPMSPCGSSVCATPTTMGGRGRLLVASSPRGNPGFNLGKHLGMMVTCSLFGDDDDDDA